MMARSKQSKTGREGSSAPVGDAGGAPVPEDFTDLVFGRCDPEDVAALDRDTLERLARDAFGHLARPRRRLDFDIRLTDARTSGPRPREITVLEVVNDNMPFLLDSTLAEINEHGHTIRLVAHPILRVRRDAQGGVAAMSRDGAGQPVAGEHRESLIHIHLDRIDDASARAALVAGLDAVFSAVRLAVSDFPAMRARVFEAVQAYQISAPPLPRDEVAEAVALLEWMLADNFTFLGVREYRFPQADTAADPIEGSGLGILRDPEVKVLRRGRELVTMTPEVRAFLAEPVPLIVTKANVKSKVHRRVHMDYVGIKLFDADGALSGELRIVGLFTAIAYTSSPSDVPFVRRKAKAVIERAGHDPASHAGRAMMNVLENYPRDELFQIDVETLYGFAQDIATLSERPRVRALARLDRFDRFVSVLVFIPKDRYDTQVRRNVGLWLAEMFGGRLSASYPAYPEGPLSRTHYIIGRDEGTTPRVDRETIETGIEAIVATWADALRETAGEDVDGRKARLVAERFGEAFSPAYRATFGAATALADIAVIEGLPQPGARAVHLYAREGRTDRAGLKIFSRGERVSLSERVPVLENLGFSVLDENTFRITPAGDDEPVFLHDMTLARAAGGDVEVDLLTPRLEAALMALFAGLAESDRYDALVVEAGLAWREVSLVRALSRFLQQARIRFTQDYMAQTLARHPAFARALVALFCGRFDPSRKPKQRAGDEAAAREAIAAALDRVTSLDEDRILRRFVNLVDAVLRTTFFQTGPDGQPKDVIAFKFESRRIEALPLPRPLYEIFVHSPRVEGVHLRFGKVARGGLRWSDRPQDFRTEVLGLVKAQQVKNAVIVPVGAKGGFVPKRLPPPANRDAWLAEGTHAYRIFVGTLLELTDNIATDGAILPPPDTVRLDGDDPYLVVAADKGTATFSDTANALSIARGHWLGDAFASGGSQGYDHKGMGITARGAWEAVKRHFREIDHDIQTHPFTVAGVGDMSGDVFGNGMLLSKAIRLVAAFDHRDIFLDPEPDPAASFAERRRLFGLPRSSWKDYDPKLISKGGGVFSRSAKSIPLSPQMRALIDLDQAEATPTEVMHAILKAPVDLLWFGGIGTYVRAADETDDEVGDRANDAIRVTGNLLRCRVVGEGANLGVTQRGRIEAARAGIRLNTDAIDNSAGVNTSDVEVNIKIALTTPERDGRLGEAARNALLAEMTDEVAGLVLRNNYLQTLSLSLSQRRGLEDLGFARGLMHRLEAEGRLDRAVENLPDDVVLAEREARGESLTRPETAVLLAYAKLSLFDAVLDSDVPDDAYFVSELNRYFPAPVRERFPDAVLNHRLRREIIATQLSNAVANRCGATVVARIADRTGADAAAIARAYALTRDTFGLLDINNEIDDLDTKIAGATQLALYAAVQDTVLDRMVWFIRNIDLQGELAPVVARFRPGVEQVAKALPKLLSQDQAAERARRIEALAGEGVPKPLASRIAGLPGLSASADAVIVSERSGIGVAEATATLFALDEAFGLGRLRAAAEVIAPADRYENLAIDRALDSLDLSLRRIGIEVTAGGGSGRPAVEAWFTSRAAAGRVAASLQEMTATAFSQAKLTLAASLIADLARE
jgi:glutamate dehydrogenase